MKIHENLWRSMKLISMYRIYLFGRKKMGYILYSNNINASHMCLQRKTNCLTGENGNHGCRENIDFDMQHACHNHLFDDNFK